MLGRLADRKPSAGWARSAEARREWSAGAGGRRALRTGARGAARAQHDGGKRPFTQLASLGQHFRCGGIVAHADRVDSRRARFGERLAGTFGNLQRSARIADRNNPLWGESASNPAAYVRDP